MHRVDPKKTVFDMICWITPMPDWMWLNRNEPQPKSPEISGALVTFWVTPPAEFGTKPHIWACAASRAHHVRDFAQGRRRNGWGGGGPTGNSGGRWDFRPVHHLGTRAVD